MILIKSIYRKNKAVTADYHIFKNLIFAKRTLSEVEYEKYESIYQILTKDMPVPNMVIYLDASLDVLVDRIDMRGRDFEKKISSRLFGATFMLIIVCLSMTLRKDILKYQFFDLMGMK